MWPDHMGTVASEMMNRHSHPRFCLMGLGEGCGDREGHGDDRVGQGCSILHCGHQSNLSKAQISSHNPFA